MPIQIVADNEEFVFESEGSLIFYRRLPDDVGRRLRKKNTKVKKRPRPGQDAEIVELDDLMNDIIEYVVIRWENVVDPTSGEEVPCTDEMKRKLPSDIKNELVALAQEGSGKLAEEKKSESNSSENISSSLTSTPG